MSQKIPRFYIMLVLVVVLFSGLLSACSGSKAEKSHQNLEMASLDKLPAEIKTAPLAVRQAYQFAVANPQVLQAIPCYCGCGVMGHTSNYSCYVSDVQADGKVIFDNHSLGCSICVDITQDTMRLLQQGKPVPEIKEYVGQTYSRYGPATLP